MKLITKLKIKWQVFLLVLPLLFCNLKVNAQPNDSLKHSRTAKGKMYLQIGIGLLPSGGNLSFHYFLANRVSIAPDINVAMIAATELTKYTNYLPNGQPWYTGTKTEYRQAVGFQFGVRCNLHFKKNPKKIDPYFAFGIHYTVADYNFRDVATGPTFGKPTWLERTNNYFLPVSAAIGYRAHLKKVSAFTEIGFGSYLLRAGLAFRMN